MARAWYIGPKRLFNELSDESRVTWDDDIKPNYAALNEMMIRLPTNADRPLLWHATGVKDWMPLCTPRICSVDTVQNLPCHPTVGLRDTIQTSAYCDRRIRTIQRARHTIACGDAHALAILHDRSIRCWGDNTDGQAPPHVAGSFVAVAAGGQHSIGLRTDGTLAFWGDNDCGQAPPTAHGTFTAIAAGLVHSMGLHTDGSVTVWGDTMTNGDMKRLEGPFVEICASCYASFGLHPDGRIQAWGSSFGLSNVLHDDLDFLRDEQFVYTTFLPGTYTSIYGGHDSLAAVTANGSIMCWPRRAQNSVPSTFKCLAAAVGEWHALALDATGTIVFLRLNNAYNRFLQSSDTPVRGPYVAVAAGKHHSIALKEDGTITSWGLGWRYGYSRRDLKGPFLVDTSA